MQLLTLPITLRNLGSWLGRAAMGGGAIPYAWSRIGVVLEPSGSEQSTYEPTVLYEGNAQILSGTVFKMWYTAEVPTQRIHYAESVDGVTWTKYASNPVLTPGKQGRVMKNGSTYYLFVTNTSTNQKDLYTSANGISWTLDTANVISKGAGGAWDDAYIANSFVWVEDSTWYMLYTARDVAASRWMVGLATASDPAGPWTKDANNPVISRVTGTVGHAYVKKVGDTYYCWTHDSTFSSSSLPTDLYRRTSTDLVNWTLDPSGSSYPRRAVNEGYNTAIGQVADVSFVEVGDYAYFYHAASVDGGGILGKQKIKLSKAPIAVISETIPSNALADTPITGDWWDPFGDIGAGCVAAYQPKGASDLADSYVDLSGSGNDAAPGVAPTWDAVNGWIFNGVDQYLDTGLVPAVGWSMVVVYTNKAGENGIMGELTTGARFEFVPRASGDIVFGNGGVGLQAPFAAAATLATAQRTGYRDGVPHTNAISTWTAAADKTIAIGARNDGASLNYGVARIQAAAIYNVNLTGAQIDAIYQAVLDQL